jgi:tyrosine-protein phosphatase SIW14
MRKIWVSRMIVSLLWLQALTDYSAIGSAIEHIPNLQQIEPGLYRGGRPQLEGLDTLASMNVKTIINLERGWFSIEPEEVKQERLFAVENNIQFIHIPMHPFFRPPRKDIQRALDAIVDPANHPIFIHCHKGSDRTGVVVAALRIHYQGWTSEQAEMEMRHYGYRNVFLFWWRNVLEEFGAEVNNKPYVI